ncbi:hypothetical protein PVAND_009917 [Polypedilum vanderplanki]|uniref:Gustatory receptor n=1 Tax=Polypedilum vanderplanki TaxID=319348 RepID=A0A9J6CF25_POLVA|nr:hypothetical protein PVAND_009917 [Polypedilum vanderplanki]
MSQQKIFKQIEKFSQIVFQFCGFNSIPISDGKYLTEVYLRIWTFFVFVCVISATVIAIKYDDVVFSDSFVGKANDMLKFVTVYFSFAVCIAESFLNNKKLKKFYSKFKKFVKEIEISDRKLLSFSLKFRKNYSIIFAVMFIISIAMEIFMISCIGFSKQWQYFWILNLIPILACRMRNLQYFYVLSIIKLQIRVIRDELRNIVEFTKWNLNLSSRDVHEILIKLQNIKCAYGRSFESTNIVNEFFSQSLAANIVHEYVQSACDYYWSYIIFSEVWREEAHSAIILSATIPLVFLLFSLYHAEKVKFEASQIAPLLHSIRKRKCDVKLYRMIHQFSLQITQEEISFHASSIFTVNLSLFISVINALLSYLVIFIQFSSIPDDRRDKYNKGEYSLSIKNPFFDF